MFSYGSGLTSTMFSFKLHDGQHPFSLSNIASILNLSEKLKSRHVVCTFCFMAHNTTPYCVSSELWSVCFCMMLLLFMCFYSYISSEHNKWTMLVVCCCIIILLYLPTDLIIGKGPLRQHLSYMHDHIFLGHVAVSIMDLYQMEVYESRNFFVAMLFLKTSKILKNIIGIFGPIDSLHSWFIETQSLSIAHP